MTIYYSFRLYAVLTIQKQLLCKYVLLYLLYIRYIIPMQILSSKMLLFTNFLSKGNG